jgi:peptide/nickel transport system ATP-binding protein
VSTSAASGVPIVDITGLTVTFPRDGDPADAGAVLRDLSLTIRPNERVAMVGSSGSGKTLSALAMLGLLPSGAETTGRTTVGGRPLDAMTPHELRATRGGTVALAFQESSAAFNPVLTIGVQLIETLRCHGTASRSGAPQHARDLLDRVGLGHHNAAFAAYPHQLSGGQLQRAGLALALCGDPQLLIADEPTTALDPQTRSEIETVLAGELERSDRALLLLGHDLSLARRITSRTVVMLEGDLVEDGPTGAVLSRPRHPYTAALVAAERALVQADASYGAGDSTASQIEPSVGCRYASSCPMADADCHVHRQPLVTIGCEWWVRCSHWDRAGGPGGD